MLNAPSEGRFLAIDYGTRKSGLAVTDPLKVICQPLKTVATTSLIEELIAFVRKENVVKIIVGWPIQEDGSMAEITRTVENFVGRLKKKIKGVDIELWDERYSSVRAREKLLESGLKKKKRNERGRVDSMAALVILEEYLEANPLS